MLLIEPHGNKICNGQGHWLLDRTNHTTYFIYRSGVLFGHNDCTCSLEHNISFNNQTDHTFLYRSPGYVWCGISIMQHNEYTSYSNIMPVFILLGKLLRAILYILEHTRYINIIHLSSKSKIFETAWHASFLFHQNSWNFSSCSFYIILYNNRCSLTIIFEVIKSKNINYTVYRM